MPAYLSDLNTPRYNAGNRPTTPGNRLQSREPTYNAGKPPTIPGTDLQSQKRLILPVADLQSPEMAYIIGKRLIIFVADSADRCAVITAFPHEQ